MTSWKTSAAGIISLVGAAVQLVPDNAPGAMYIKPYAAAMASIASGLGLLAARDNNVSSIQVQEDRMAKASGGANDWKPIAKDQNQP